MLYTHLPKKADIAALGEGVVTVLEQVGAMFQNAALLDALEAAGARVDRAQEHAWFPTEVTRSFLAGVRAEYAARPRKTRFTAPGRPHLSTQVAQYVYDFDRQERRPGTRADFIELIRFGDGLDEGGSVGHCLLLQDVPPLLEPLYAARLLAEYAHQPEGPFAWNVAQEPYLQEMGEIMGRRHWYTWGAVCMAHPLRFDKALADRYVTMLREGHRAGVTAMPTAGVSAPITVEGFTVVACAELVASWMAGRALVPTAPLGGSMWVGMPDMKSGQVSFSAPDAMFYGIASMQFLKEWSGVTVDVGGGEYSAAKAPGLYAGLEKAYKAMTIAAFTGQHPYIGEGMVDNGKVLSDVQLLIDRELTIGLEQYQRPLTADPARIGMEAILEVGLALHGGSHLLTDHTAHYFRESLWFPELLSRTGWNGPEDEAAQLRSMRERAVATAARYQKPEGREEQLRALDQVIERARRDLL